MRRTNLKLDNFDRATFSKLTVFAAILFAFFPAISRAQQQGQKTFASAAEASQALFNAAQANDDKAVLEVLGPEGKKIISSGDPAEDEESRSNFVQKFQVMHRLVKEPDGTTTLYVGAENWPTPIPLLNKGDLWYFDTEAGKREILFRRIGNNELSAIRVCEELVAAEKDYSSKQNGQYAAKFVSDEGKHNGLYWLGTDNQFESPIGPLVANAGSEGGVAPGLRSGPVPFRGYYFRILESQGKHGPGGPLDYVSDGKMTKGFAFVAYPAVYRDSGVMTFIVGRDGAVYERDLGKQTEERAKTMKAYDPDPSWTRSEEPEQPADHQTQSSE
jgi:hypothetical protein